MYQFTKTFEDISFAHREHLHVSEMERMIHGHNWRFKFVFATDSKAALIKGVYSGYEWLDTWIKTVFDHKLVISKNDSELNILFKGLRGCADYAPISDNVSALGIAEYLMLEVSRMLKTATANEVFLLEVAVFEDYESSARVTCDEFESD